MPTTSLSTNFDYLIAEGAPEVLTADYFEDQIRDFHENGVLHSGALAVVETIPADEAAYDELPLSVTRGYRQYYDLASETWLPITKPFVSVALADLQSSRYGEGLSTSQDSLRALFAHGYTFDHMRDSKRWFNWHFDDLGRFVTDNVNEFDIAYLYTKGSPTQLVVDDIPISKKTREKCIELANDQSNPDRFVDINFMLSEEAAEQIDHLNVVDIPTDHSVLVPPFALHRGTLVHGDLRTFGSVDPKITMQPSEDRQSEAATQ